METAQAKGKKKEVGLQLYSLREDLKKDAKGTIEAVGKMGYTYVETASYVDGKIYGMEPEEFSAFVKKNGMKVMSAHTGADYKGDQASWDAAMEWWDKCIADHKKAGFKYIIKPSMGAYAYESLESIKKTCDYFNAVGEKCNKAGIRFGYHNHSKEFQKVPNTDIILYDYMVQNTDPAKVTFELDVYWIYKGGQSAVDYFNKYPGRFELWHVKDMVKTEDMFFAPVGSGRMDFASIFAEKETSGMKYFFVEQDSFKDLDPMESIEMSYKYLSQSKFL